MRRIFLFVLVVAVALVAAAVWAEDYILVQKTPSFAEPKEGEAVIYFLRPAFAGKAVKMWAFVDDAPAGANKSKHYTYVVVPAGKHLVWAKAENISALEIDAESGKTYYVKQALRMGALKARVKLELLTPEEGQKGLQECKYTTLTPEGRARGEEIARTDYEKARQKAHAGAEDEEAGGR